MCLGIALQAAVGTVVTGEGVDRVLVGRLGGWTTQAARVVGLLDTFSSPLFLSLLLALAANVVACTWHRTATARHAGRAWGARRWLDLIVHASVLVMLGGRALTSTAGSLSTQYLFPGLPATTAREGGTGPEVPIGFSLVLKERVEEHFPLVLQAAVRDTRTGKAFPRLLIREDRDGVIRERDWRFSIRGYDLDQGWVTVQSSAAGRILGEQRFSLSAGGKTSGRFGDQEVQLLAWRRDVRSVRGRIAILDGGREVREEWLGPNGRIVHRGKSVFLSTWGEDRFGNAYLGVQVSSDPGAPVFWAGAAALAAALPGLIVLRRRAS